MRYWRIQVRFVLKINIKQYKLIITFMLGEAFVGIRSVGTGGVFTDSLFSAWPGSLFAWLISYHGRNYHNFQQITQEYDEPGLNLDNSNSGVAGVEGVTGREELVDEPWLPIGFRFLSFKPCRTPSLRLLPRKLFNVAFDNRVTSLIAFW